MSVRGDFAEDYEEANRLLRETIRGPDGTVSCAECDQEAIDWTVSGDAFYSLIAECEYCGEREWLYFDEDPPWSGEN